MLIYKTDETKIDNEFALDIKEGLTRTTNAKYILPKYLYDSVGSELFEVICDQPEYYPTRTELAILKQCSPQIVKMFDHQAPSIVELGSGSAKKTKILLEHFLLKKQNLYYFPIDVSHDILQYTMKKLSSEFSRLRTIGICADYIKGIEKAGDFIGARNPVPNRKLILFLGSTIGNFEPKNAKSFLRTIRRKMEKNDNLLLGIDLLKDKRIMEAAYNDKREITAKFNLNLLSRINRELGGEFVLSNFRHHAFFNQDKGRVEMHLISECDQQVVIDRIGECLSFAQNERVHTENSYKYSPAQIRGLANDAGLTLKKNFYDKKKWFSLSLLSPAV